MCRSEAMRLHALKPKFDAAGCDLVCLLKENIPEQVDQFLAGGGVAGEFWSKETPLFLDDDMTFFRALGGGKLRKGGLSSFLPFAGFWKRYGKIKNDVTDHNLEGEGAIKGGLYVVSKAGIHYEHYEKDLGWWRHPRRFSPRARRLQRSELIHFGAGEREIPPPTREHIPPRPSDARAVKPTYYCGTAQGG